MKKQTTEPAHRELLEEINRELFDYFVAFVRLLKKASPEDAELAGSGTLVEFEGVHAILTADHVIKNLPSIGELSLLLTTRIQPQPLKPTIDMKYLEKVTIARGPIEEDGPDIGLLILSPTQLGTIKAKKAFYNLGKRRKRILSNPPSIRDGPWFLSGAIEEWTEDTLPKRGFDRGKTFGGMSGDGVVDREYTNQGYDFFDFETKYDENYEGPIKYGGMSGGGLWQIMIEKSENDHYRVKDRILSGVAFYQSSLEDDIRIIKCNGRRCIYEKVIEAMRERA